jgi:hypothetical protein
MFSFEGKIWFELLTNGQKDLVLQCQDLYNREKLVEESAYLDYSFVVFPLAKAYEGFLKKYFRDLGLISQKTFESDHLRIGKSLNPDLPERYRRKDWVVSGINELCGEVREGRWKGKLLSQALWTCWKRGRNLLFHFFPHLENFISLDEARVRIEEISAAMEAATYCRREVS